jgi:MFS family permease
VILQNACIVIVFNLSFGSCKSQTPPLKSRSENLVFFTIIAAQFFGTSLWFAGNAILFQLQTAFDWPTAALGYLTSSTQLGFIAGTLLFAVLGLPDKFSPSRIFFISSLIAGGMNVLPLINLSSMPLMIFSRLGVGFFLAGIYPIGMKIASDWKAKGLGHWLGALVGALVLGTAFPHSLKLIPQFVDPKVLLITISSLCITGGFLLVFLVPDGPYRRSGSVFTFSGFRNVFRISSFRAPALGYFGHMWELYTFWAFVPWIISVYHDRQPLHIDESLLAFLVIGAGAVGCVCGGLLSNRIGSARVARVALICSGLCCCVSPLLWNSPSWFFIAIMLFWGVMAAGDSPQFSALVAKYSPEQFRGSAITLVICIGFSITIVSIQLLNYLQAVIPYQYLFLILIPGPLFGVIAFNKLFRLNEGR